MKRNIIHILWAAVLIPFALASCRQEVLPGETDGSNAQPFVITVTDGGYTSEATDGMGKTGSRATENGYTTTFTAGDQCGLYIVRGTEIVYDNICLTASVGANGSIIWQAPSGTDLYGGVANERYFLYYPYQENMTNKVTVADDTTDDAAFFAQLISDWKPKADQSDYTTGYTASDLMTATGTASYADGTLSLSFPMTHRMAMAVIKMPGISYNIGDYSYNYIKIAEFSGSNIPYLMTDGSSRYLVNPKGSDGITLNGCYDGNREFTVTPSNISGGNYKTYKVDGAKKTEIDYKLQAGDYFMKSGFILSKDTYLTKAQKAECIGIVFWAVDATDYDLVLQSDFSNCTNGLVVSLKEIKSHWQDNFANSTIQSWASSQEFYTSGNYKPLNYNVSDGTEKPGDIQGYNNTKILKEYNNSTNGSSCPVTILKSFGTITEGVVLPDGRTSGWYLPSPKELNELSKAKDAVNASLININPEYGLKNDYYWSSAELQYNSAYSVTMVNGNVGTAGKTNGGYVRLVFAF